MPWLDGVVKTFDQLYAELRQRVATDDPESGTVRAVRAGVHTIGKKVVEEAAEVWMAAEYQTDAELAEEISQLLYHVQVMMLARRIEPAAVYARL
jgi:phosphoribosyl-ATP pyrophosphohydrolase